MRKYLIDSCSLMTPSDLWYRQKVFPTVWEYLTEQICGQKVLLSNLVVDECQVIPCHVNDWVKWLKRECDVHPVALDGCENTVQQVTNLYRWATDNGFTAEAKDDFFRPGVADPWLCAYASVHDLVVVTEEAKDVGGNGRKRIRLPNACDHLHCEWIRVYEMFDELEAHFS